MITFISREYSEKLLNVNSFEYIRIWFWSVFMNWIISPLEVSGIRHVSWVNIPSLNMQKLTVEWRRNRLSLVDWRWFLWNRSFLPQVIALEGQLLCDWWSNISSLRGSVSRLCGGIAWLRSGNVSRLRSSTCLVLNYKGEENSFNLARYVIQTNNAMEKQLKLPACCARNTFPRKHERESDVYRHQEVGILPHSFSSAKTKLLLLTIRHIIFHGVIRFTLPLQMTQTLVRRKKKREPNFT